MHLIATKKYGFFFTVTLLLSGCTSAGLANEVPSHCLSSEEVYFSCLMKNGKILSLCGDSNNQNKSIAYRYGNINNLELIFPAGTSESEKQFKYNNYFRYGVDYYRVGFLSGQYYYQIYRDIDNEETPKLRAGIIVESISDINKKEFNLPCAGSVEDNLGELSDFLECDKESALGCAD
jgi:hypothetical protein